MEALVDPLVVVAAVVPDTVEEEEDEAVVPALGVEVLPVPLEMVMEDPAGRVA